MSEGEAIGSLPTDLNNPRVNETILTFFFFSAFIEDRKVGKNLKENVGTKWKKADKKKERLKVER